MPRGASLRQRTPRQRPDFTVATTATGKDRLSAQGASLAFGVLGAEQSESTGAVRVEPGFEPNRVSNIKSCYLGESGP